MLKVLRRSRSGPELSWVGLGSLLGLYRQGFWVGVVVKLPVLLRIDRILGPRGSGWRVADVLCRASACRIGVCPTVPPNQTRTRQFGIKMINPYSSLHIYTHIVAPSQQNPGIHALCECAHTRLMTRFKDTLCLPTIWGLFACPKHSIS